jgi:post-segregation antitoxin (ccd killing protein)
LSEYQRKISDKPVRKTVYIPQGLNDRAEELGLNFSKILREALANKVNE